MRRWTRVMISAGAALAVGVWLYATDGHAQAVGDGPTSVVMTSPQQGDNWGNAIGNLTWPGAAFAVVNRFLTVLERMVTDTRGFLDRWLDKTNGKLRVDFKKTVYNTGWVEDDPDRTGPVPTHNRRRTDPRDRNGTSGSNGEDDYHE